MGAWGLGSDENDWPYDACGFGIMLRASGVTLTAQGRSADGGVVEDIADDFNGDASVFSKPGVAILLLKLGCPVPVKNLDEARKELVEEVENYAEKSFFGSDDSEERKAIIQDEIAIIDDALNYEGVVPGPPIGARPIAHSRAAQPRPYNLDDRQGHCKYCRRPESECTELVEEVGKGIKGIHVRRDPETKTFGIDVKRSKGKNSLTVVSLKSGTPAKLDGLLKVDDGKSFGLGGIIQSFTLLSSWKGI